MSLKKKLLNKEKTIGSWLTIPHTSVVEILASAGFEWLTIDIEHTSITMDQCFELIAAIQGNGMKALVRVSKNEEVVIKKVLDAGADGIIVPMVKNRTEALQALDYTYYPPRGKRGVGLSRAQKYGIGFDQYKQHLNDNIVVIAQIEHIKAVENIEEIVTTDGIDGIIVGPYDLSGSMGIPGEYHKPEVQEALLKIEETCKRLNKTLGFHVIQSDASFTKEKINKGYNLIAFSLDFFFLGDKAREEMKKLKGN
ncbi:MAG: 2,4-dihydroxyhept-2-ene-1,7-dioic acid aldolase [Flavobacteriales bacterium]|nr:2,4-dihydroxyhept-2-ene-1,7-dioic acid aldolase [Flavobacteriales bacterium]|tara:strand:+ start:724 stop:1482 length:759 start_codon:yes stop_codon:yes gene_type:complete